MPLRHDIRKVEKGRFLLRKRRLDLEKIGTTSLLEIKFIFSDVKEVTFAVGDICD